MSITGDDSYKSHKNQIDKIKDLMQKSGCPDPEASVGILVLSDLALLLSKIELLKAETKTLQDEVAQLNADTEKLLCNTDKCLRKLGK